MQLAQAIDTYLKSLDNLGYSKSTITSYALDLKSFSQRLKPDAIMRPIQVSSVDIEDFINRPDKTGKLPSSSYRNRRLSCLRSFFRFLEEKKVLTKAENPTRSIRFAKVVQSEPSSLTYGEYARIIQAVRQNTSGWMKRRDLAIIALLYNTGIRLSELISLNMEQVDIANARLVGLKRKGGNHKDLLVNQTVLWALSAWLCVHPYPRLECPCPLFMSRLPRRLSKRTVEQLVGKYAKKAGIEKRVSPHTFRHSVCSELQRRGASIRATQELLNHLSLQTTMRYSHSLEIELRTALASLDDASLWLEESRMFARKGLT